MNETTYQVWFYDEEARGPFKVTRDLPKGRAREAAIRWSAQWPEREYHVVKISRQSVSYCSNGEEL